MPVFKSSRKVQNFGSSLALTLPAMFVKANEVRKGQIGKVIYDIDGVLVVSCVEDVEDLKKGLIEIITKLEETIQLNSIE